METPPARSCQELQVQSPSWEASLPQSQGEGRKDALRAMLTEAMCTHQVNATASQKLFITIHSDYLGGFKTIYTKLRATGKANEPSCRSYSFLPKDKQLKDLALKHQIRDLKLSAVGRCGSLAALLPSWRSAPLKTTAHGDTDVCPQAANLKNSPRDFSVTIFILLIICL